VKPICRCKGIESEISPERRIAGYLKIVKSIVTKDVAIGDAKENRDSRGNKPRKAD